MKEIELKSLRKEREKHFLREDGLIVAKMYDDDIHYKNGNEYIEIDNTLIKEKGYYYNKDNSYKVYFPEVSDKVLMRTENNNHYICYTLQDSNIVEAKIDVNGSKLYKDIKYINILNGIDFEYNVMPKKVKENIIINNKESVVDSINFLLDTDLDLILNNDSSIDAKYDGKTVFKIESPYIIGKNGQMLNSVSYRLIKNDTHYILKLLLNKEEILKSTIDYPIIIDPTITNYGSSNSVYDVYIYEGDSNSDRNSQSFLKVGVEKIDNQYITNRTLLKFDLPKISTGSQIIYAELTLIGYPIVPYSYDSSIVNVHQLTQDWDETTADWNSMNDKFNSRIEGSFESSRSGVSSDNNLITYLSGCELTGLVKKWYTDTPNYGIMLKLNKEVYTTDVIPMFYSKNNTVNGANPKPILTIIYRNQNGIENYMNYKEQLFMQGKSYLNTYNGNLTSIFEIGSTKTGKLPINLNIVYNTNDVILNKNLGYGVGCNLSLNQIIKETIIDETNYLEYMDEDGTLHYFRMIDNVYKDEDGLDMIIDKKDNECILKDKNNNKMYFTRNDSLYYLTKLEDVSNNVTSIMYDENVRISKIIDPSLFEINLSYSDNKIVITSPKDLVSLNYNNNRLVSLITKSGITSFEYNNNGLISGIIDENGKRIEYEYYDIFPYRVKKVSEIGLENTSGNYFSLTYNFNSTTIIDYKNNAETITFNNYGNVASITTLKEHNDILDAYGKCVEYGDDNYSDGSTYIPTKNKLLNSDISCKYVKNYLSNSSFEESNILFSKTNDVVLSISSDDSVSGFKSLKAVSSSSNQIIYQDIVVPKGDYYTFSLYIKNSSMAKISICYTDENNQIQEKLEQIIINNSFERYDTTIYYPNSATSDLTIKVILEDAGLYYIDDIQLEKGEVANFYNLLDNSDFSKGLDGWQLTAEDRETFESINTSDIFSKVILEKGITALKIDMNPANSTSIAKTFNVKGKAGDKYAISFWYKNEGYPAYDTEGSPISNNVIISFYYSDNENGHGIAPSKGFNPNENEWQYFVTNFQSEQDFESMTLNFFQYNNANALYITNICLFKDVRNINYEYDDAGNLTSVNDLTNKTTSFDHNSNNELVKMTDPKGNNLTYEYNRDITSQVINGISETGILNKFFYDVNNNPIRNTISKLDSSNTTKKKYYKIKIYGTNKYIRCTPTGIVITEDDSPLNKWRTKEEKEWEKLSHCVLESLYLNADDNHAFLSGLYCYINFHPNSDHTYLMEISNIGLYLKFDGTNIVVSQLEDNIDPFKFYIETYDDLFIENDATYSASGKVITSTKDSLLHKTIYNIDEETGLTNSITDPNGTVTSYTYNDKDELVSITMKDKSVTYSYNNQNLLDKINQGAKEYAFVYDNFFNTKQIKLNNIVLVTNNYEENNGNLSSSTYGNNQAISFEYDNFDRLIKKVKSDDIYQYKYDSNGSLTKVLSNNDIIKYTYDMAKRVREYRCNDFRVKYTYDSNGNVVLKKYILNAIEHEIEHTLNDEDEVIKTMFDSSELNYKYDDLERLKSISGIIDEEYSYVTNGKRTSMLIKTNGNYSYIYNRLNNITHIYNDGVLEHRYYYDEYSQLIKEHDYIQNQTITYTYNSSGNLLSKKIYVLNTTALINENTYEYTNTNWEDQLTKFNNTAITYDEIGNPLTIGDTHLTWINGRQLNKYQDSDYTINYKYNDNGIRTKKIVNNVEVNYHLEGSKIIFEQRGDNVLYYMYSEADELIGFEYNSIPYYYLKNNQNDIIGIIDANKNVLAKYTYDSWGKIISIKDNNNTEITSNTHIANINSFRYRSYYYDSETKLYYLNSRYYNPEWGRFINADGTIGANEDILSYNLYIYVSNNPVNNVDIDGHFALTMFSNMIYTAIVVVTAIVVSKTISNTLSGTSLAFPTRKRLEMPDLTKVKSKAEAKSKTKSKVTSKVAAVSKAKEDVTKKDVTKPCTRAKLVKNDVKRYGERLSVEETANIVMRGNDVMCDTELDVLAVGVSLPFGFTKNSAEKHGESGTYYYHYHPVGVSSRPHIWFYS